ncbi:MAG: hypothetical protein WBX27_09075 [Specibacter sp.]
MKTRLKRPGFGAAVLLADVSHIPSRVSPACDDSTRVQIRLPSTAPELVALLREDGCSGVECVVDDDEVAVSFGGDLHGWKCFVIGGLDGESVEFFKGDPDGVVGDEC